MNYIREYGRSDPKPTMKDFADSIRILILEGSVQVPDEFPLPGVLFHPGPQEGDQRRLQHPGSFFRDAQLAEKAFGHEPGHGFGIPGPPAKGPAVPPPPALGEGVEGKRDSEDGNQKEDAMESGHGGSLQGRVCFEFRVRSPP